MALHISYCEKIMLVLILPRFQTKSLHQLQPSEKWLKFESFLNCSYTNSVQGTQVDTLETNSFPDWVLHTLLIRIVCAWTYVLFYFTKRKQSRQCLSFCVLVWHKGQAALRSRHLLTRNCSLRSGRFFIGDITGTDWQRGLGNKRELTLKGERWCCFSVPV